ncbi:DinB family protein [Bacillus sp. JJ1122]|uniref:DinB family protein n=1 Tax=Bacillus sp. JJ1122 TaxID=3122951 RepID=UPI002FFD808D
MKMLFNYNWAVRDDWYKWCEGVSEGELLAARTGGMGGVLQTLFHIIDVEWSWIRLLQGKDDFQENFELYNTLDKVKKLDAKFKAEVKEFVLAWNGEMENRILQLRESDGSSVIFTWGEIMRHTLAHEIHHIGQISVWAREIGKQPVTANFIGRGLFQNEQG